MSRDLELNDVCFEWSKHPAVIGAYDGFRVISRGICTILCGNSKAKDNGVSILKQWRKYLITLAESIDGAIERIEAR